MLSPEPEKTVVALDNVPQTIKLFLDDNSDNTQDDLQLSFKDRDERFYHLQQVIDEKSKLLIENQQKLNQISKENNEFLEKIKNDYTKYNNYIVKQKNDQIAAFRVINEYIQNLYTAGALSEQNLKDSKEEQKKILHEIDDIKNNLQRIIGKQTL